ncbi:hypothetical protein QR680_011243 [Steinernema hermaphroditum]|uniref:Actin n=1 Tax=Steinernema hermaphroditum TaxID=289476 RepID=A0AA39ITD3_9BILA|nr:hypothetical protein QR680_011243 [Steinernema hermaphroditum]
MSGGVYGGDEVGAVVFDAGSHTFRVGYAGEEFPKADVSSYAGIRALLDSVDTTVDAPARPKKNEYFIGEPFVTVPRVNTEVATFMKDGLIHDWDLFEAYVDYMYNKVLFTESKYHAALFSEPAWNTKECREKLTELMFEKYNVPAFYVVKNAVLTVFASGRTSGLVLDSGASQTSAVPVYDGYCINHAVVHSPMGGDVVVDQCFDMLRRYNIDVVPTYKIASKSEVNENDAPIWTPKKNLPQVTESYDRYMKKRVVEDLAASVLQISDAPIDIDHAEKLPSSPYCFPCGLKKEFHADRVKAPEGIFDLSYLTCRTPEMKSQLLSVAQVASMSAGMCDIDIRPSLFSSVMVTGGNSYLMGFTERLNHDLAHKCPPTIKLRVTSSPTLMERRFSAWIGGSIVGSLGMFQQMWISKQEYGETGKGIVEKKCP